MLTHQHGCENLRQGCEICQPLCAHTKRQHVCTPKSEARALTWPAIGMVRVAPRAHTHLEGGRRAHGAQTIVTSCFSQADHRDVVELTLVWARHRHSSREGTNKFDYRALTHTRTPTYTHTSIVREMRVIFDTIHKRSHTHWTRSVCPPACIRDYFIRNYVAGRTRVSDILADSQPTIVLASGARGVLCSHMSGAVTYNAERWTGRI